MVDAAVVEHVGVDHAAAEDLEPAGVLAEAAALAPADAARDVDLAAGLCEREEVRAVARGALLAEHLADEVVERALEVAEGDALVHDEALDLVELRQVAGIGGVGAEHRARADHVDGRLLLLHGVCLHAGGLGAQQDVGLAIGVDLGVLERAGVVVLDVEGVTGASAGVVERGVERGEVVVARLDVGAVLDGVAHAAEDLLHLLDDLGDEVLGAHVGHAARQRHVHRVGGDARLEGRMLELVATVLERRLHAGAHLVGELAHLRALLRRELAHLTEYARERAPLAGDGDANLVESAEVRRPPDALGRLGLDGLEVVDDCHPCCPFRSRAPGPPRPRGCDGTSVRARAHRTHAKKNRPCLRLSAHKGG